MLTAQRCRWLDRDDIFLLRSESSTGAAVKRRPRSPQGMRMPACLPAPACTCRTSSSCCPGGECEQSPAQLVVLTAPLRVIAKVPAAPWCLPVPALVVTDSGSGVVRHSRIPGHAWPWALAAVGIKLAESRPSANRQSGECHDELDGCGCCGKRRSRGGGSVWCPCSRGRV